MNNRLRADDLVTALKAAAEPTRLRILLLLANAELSVKDLTRVLGQSQPRISRHLKLLHEAGLIERSREGSWVFFTLASTVGAAGLARTLVTQVDLGDGAVARDRERADALKAERERAAQAYFANHAADWDQIRALHVAEAEVEAAMLAAFGERRFDLLVDLGTGTGRILDLFAGHYERAIGIDASPAMLAYARAKLGSSERAHVRQGDIYDLPLPDGAAGAVMMHQVLHFLSDPARAVGEAARVLAPGGELMIVDFAPHALEFLRDRFAHDRLGFSHGAVEAWLRDEGLDVVSIRDLAPKPADGDRLTVSIWVARRPATVTDDRTHPAAVRRLDKVEQSL